MDKTSTADKDVARIRDLIESAAASVGGQNKLARAMGYNESQLSRWAQGLDTCPPPAQAVMAHHAGLDAVEVLVLATVAHARSTEKKEALLAALGKRFAHLGAAAFLGISAVFELAQTTGLIDTMRRRVKPA